MNSNNTSNNNSSSSSSLIYLPYSSSNNCNNSYDNSNNYDNYDNNQQLQLQNNNFHSLELFYKDLASNSFKCGNINDTISYSIQALKYLTKNNNQTSNYSNLVLEIMKIGQLYYKQLLFSESLNWYKEALEIEETYYPNNTLVISEILYYLGLIYYHLNEYEKALGYFNESKAIKFVSCPFPDEKNAEIMFYIGIIHKHLGNDKVAFDSFNHGIQVYELSSDSSDLTIGTYGVQLANLYIHRGEIYERWGLYRSSLSDYQKAYLILEDYSTLFSQNSGNNNNNQTYQNNKYKNNKHSNSNSFSSYDNNSSHNNNNINNNNDSDDDDDDDEEDKNEHFNIKDNSSLFKISLPSPTSSSHSPSLSSSTTPTASLNSSLSSSNNTNTNTNTTNTTSTTTNEDKDAEVILADIEYHIHHIEILLQFRSECGNKILNYIHERQHESDFDICHYSRREKIEAAKFLLNYINTNSIDSINSIVTTTDYINHKGPLTNGRLGVIFREITSKTRKLLQ